MHRSLAATAVAIAVIGTLGTGSAQAQNSFTEQAVVSCLSGATVSGLTSGLLLMPLANSGIGTPVVASAVGLSAGIGCGFGVAFTTAAAGYSWAWRSIAGSPPEQQPVRTAPDSNKAEPKGMIHAAW